MIPAHTVALTAACTYSLLVVTGTIWRTRQVQFVSAALVFAALAVVFYAVDGRWLWSLVWLGVGGLGFGLLRSARRLAALRRESEEFDRRMAELFRDGRR